jgi:cytochrome c peroxidase
MAVRIGAVVLVLAAAAMARMTRAQPMASLKSIPVPGPAQLARYVADEKALVVLGKALFWDVQVASDSTIACASCHFHAGADHRLPNQLAAPDFPFTRSEMEAGRRVASTGIVARRAAGLEGTGAHGQGVRHVTARNAPSVINAAHYFRAFWDGRASNVFTGQTSFGESDPRPNLLVAREGRLVAEAVRIENASLASQAVAPPLDEAEMSYHGRTWPMLGRKMLAARPLASQRVAPDDSVLGPLANRNGRGLTVEHYLSLVRAAFRPEYWRSPGAVTASGVPTRPAVRPTGTSEFTQAEYNFSTFFGLAVQAYESTLISDDSPYDRFLDGDETALPPAARAGLQMFRVRNCTQCHPAPELTLATYNGVRGAAGYPGLGPDGGFFYTGVEPIANDIGLGGRDGFGQLLSITGRNDPRRAAWMAGMIKTPGLRNVELTGPYFHTGSKATLEQIVDFYTFAGDYPASSLVPWGPDPDERVTIPAFLAALTDERVRFERAPFDHPELCVPIRHQANRTAAAGRGAPGRATERWASIPPVGATGNRVPLQTFEELLLGIGTDGSRAHNLAASCSPTRPGHP